MGDWVLELRGAKTGAAAGQNDKNRAGKGWAMKRAVRSPSDV